MGSRLLFTNPQVADFQAYFFRDFPFGTDIETQVTDADISKAFQQTNININPNLFADQGSYNVGYLLLAAHWLVWDLRQSSQGINGQFSFLEQSKSVGSVSQSFSVPKQFSDNPYMAMLVKTNYGAKYLNLVLPQLAGQMFASYGPPHA